ncbi:hypothetical protein CAEBREN_16963 [Caenorhabditis brenneri]|uniref:Uncharacterized protein n=1 Tax=Caenorhabditis brenneri TaxID=135651 RepID=G0PA18_CAEBE|nr:hypothetical protein CAEBREN_16963 [Caenorhabditis brenneri]
MYIEWQNYQVRRRTENGDDERDLRHRENLKKRIEETLQESVHECPICLGDANFSVMTNCGHVFCCEFYTNSMLNQFHLNKTAFFVKFSALKLRAKKLISPKITFNKLIPIRWPIPGESDEIDEQIQKNNVDLEDYNKRFSSEKSSLESILFYGKKFIRLIWIDIVRLAVLPVCVTTLYRLFCDIEVTYETLQFIDSLFLQVLVFAPPIRNFLAERLGVQ